MACVAAARAKAQPVTVTLRPSSWASFLGRSTIRTMGISSLTPTVEDQADRESDKGSHEPYPGETLLAENRSISTPCEGAQVRSRARGKRDDRIMPDLGHLCRPAGSDVE